MTVKAEWKKTGISLEHDLGDGKKRCRTFNGVNASATADKIAEFADIIGKLTGENVIGISVTRTEELTSSPANE